MTLIDKAEALEAVHEADSLELAQHGTSRIADRIAALPARGVGVKQLEWVEDFADHPFGWYESIDCGDCIVLTQSGVSVGSFHDINAAKAAAQRDYEARILAALEPARAPDLSDPVVVHLNMLRGTIAKPTVEQIIHLYGREAFRPMIDAAVAKALEDACLAVSEHADWPEDEHGRTEQVGLFARVINAIRAITPALSLAPTDAALLTGPAEAVTMPTTTQLCTWPTCGCTAKGQFCEAPVRWHPQPALAPTDAAQAREAALREAASVILNDFDALLKVAGKATEAHNSGLSLTEGVRQGLRALIGKAHT